MGTNYYLVNKPCPTCGHTREEKHIGKSSSGWQFLFRGYPEVGPVSFSEWLSELKEEGKEIRDEYGKHISLGEFINLVEYKKDDLKNINGARIAHGHPVTQKEKEYLKESQNRSYGDRSKNYWIDDEGHPFCCEAFS